MVPRTRCQKMRNIVIALVCLRFCRRRRRGCCGPCSSSPVAPLSNSTLPLFPPKRKKPSLARSISSDQTPDFCCLPSLSVRCQVVNRSLFSLFVSRENLTFSPSHYEYTSVSWYPSQRLAKREKANSHPVSCALERWISGPVGTVPMYWFAVKINDQTAFPSFS